MVKVLNKSLGPKGFEVKEPDSTMTTVAMLAPGESADLDLVLPPEHKIHAHWAKTGQVEFGGADQVDEGHYDGFDLNPSVASPNAPRGPQTDAPALKPVTAASSLAPAAKPAPKSNA